MKKIFGFIAIASLTLMVASCGAPKQVPANNATVEVVIPFSTPEYMPSADYFRATGTGVSPDITIAEKMAIQNAHVQIAEMVQSRVQEATKNYMQNTTINNTSEAAQKFQAMAKTTVDTQLQGVLIKGKKCQQNVNDGRYTYYVNVEMPTQKIKDAIEDAVAKDAKLKLDFDEFQFEKAFDAQMKDYAKQK